jgi:excisionase family DNA binding protein
MGLITYVELSKELSLSIRYLQKCVKEKEMPCIRFGRAVRFDPKVIYDWIGDHNKQLMMSMKPIKTREEKIER